jgi:hypothetical protein
VEGAAGAVALLRTLQAVSVLAPQPAVVTPEFIAQKVSEGVQLGVKEALGLLNTHSPRKGTYYKPTNGPTHSGLHKQSAPALKPSDSQVITLSTTDKPDDALRESLLLLKSRRGCGRNSRAVTDDCGAQRYNSRAQRTISRNMPHNRDYDNDIQVNDSADRDTYGAPRLTTAQQQQLRFDDELRKEVESSRLRARRLLDADENSSLNDSVSLDEETAACLRDPLTYNMKEGYGGASGGSSVASSAAWSVDDSSSHPNLRALHRDDHEQRHAQLFSDAERAAVRTDLQPTAASTHSPTTARRKAPRRCGRARMRPITLVHPWTPMRPCGRWTPLCAPRRRVVGRTATCMGI